MFNLDDHIWVEMMHLVFIDFCAVSEFHSLKKKKK